MEFPFARCSGATNNRTRPHVRALHAALTAAVALAACPAAASAHAQLESTSPHGGAVLAHEPAIVSFSFGEDVGIDGQAVRVFDRDGRRVDTGATQHPDGRGSTVGVRLRPRLARGTYTATYRVVSADTHIVTGGIVFSIGAPSAGAASVGRLLSSQRAGPVTDTAFSAVRGVQYAAIGIGGGLLTFLVVIWAPALTRAGLWPSGWVAASARMLVRARLALGLVAALGAISALAGIALQAADARGTRFWDALGPSSVSQVLPTRFGTVWGGGFVAWLVVLAGAGMLLGERRSGLVPDAAALGADGVVLPAARRRWPLAVPAVALAALIALPALAGHATLQHPVWLFTTMNVVHVTAMTLWLGGLVGLALGAASLPRPAGPDAGRVLAAALARFSPVALGCVVALIATGVVQSLIEVDAWSELVDTGYGRAILVKAGLLSVLIALGARQRRATIPHMRAAAAGDGAPADARRLLVRTVAAELAVLVAVFGAIGALSGSSPAREAHGGPGGPGAMSMSGGAMAMGGSPPAAGGGPFHEITTIGRAQLRVDVTPGRVGPNRVALTLTDPFTSRPFTRSKQLTVTAANGAEHIGPLTLAVRRTGPGSFVARGAVLGTPGRWTLAISDRTSEFAESERSVTVPIN